MLPKSESTNCPRRTYTSTSEAATPVPNANSNDCVAVNPASNVIPVIAIALFVQLDPLSNCTQSELAQAEALGVTDAPVPVSCVQRCWRYGTAEATKGLKFTFCNC